MKVNAMTGTWLSDARALRSLLPSETERAAMAICEVRRGYTCCARPLRPRDQSLEPRPVDCGCGRWEENFAMAGAALSVRAELDTPANDQNG